MEGIDDRLLARAHAAADWLRARGDAGETVTVVHHIDADGVTSGAIALEALDRAGIDHRSVAAKSLDAVHIDAINAGGHDALWFCDFGSTAYMDVPAPKIVCDHHELVRDGNEEAFPHVNPLLDDLPGDSISGAGCAFLVAHAMDPANIDLLPGALVGAAADLQDRQPPAGGDPMLRDFHGANAVFVAAGRAAGLLDDTIDLAWFGPETRPLRKYLAYAEPGVPGINGDQRSAEAFLMGLGIELRRSGTERRWCDLDPDEQQRVRAAVVERARLLGLRPDAPWRRVVRIVAAEPGTPVRELQEFGTLLNSTARYGEPATGLAVARGDRGGAYRAALDLLLDHRKHLVKSLDAFRDIGIDERVGIQTIHLQDRVRDTVVGIVCGMALDGLGLRRDMPLVGLANTDDGRTKASARAPKELQGRVDLATAMREAAAAVDGQGGGHAGAAGATIPRDAEARFIETLDAIVARQTGMVAQPRATEAPGTGDDWTASGRGQMTL